LSAFKNGSRTSSLARHLLLRRRGSAGTPDHRVTTRATVRPYPGRWGPAQGMDMRQFRVGLSIAFALYGAFLTMSPGAWALPDYLNLPIHETGHLIFNLFGTLPEPFGEHLIILGGTIFQLLLPLSFAAYFTAQRDEHAASLGIWWVGQNCLNIATYVADAQPMELPLVGGGEHDWNILLTDWGVLHHSMQYANLLRGFGALVMLVATVWGLFEAMDARERVPVKRSRRLAAIQRR
jgi:hypothetical protein